MKKIEAIKYKNIESFYYGNRLKANIYYHQNEKAFEVKLYTYGQKILKSKLFFNDNKSILENYQKAVNYARDYLQKCKY